MTEDKKNESAEQRPRQVGDVIHLSEEDYGAIEGLVAESDIAVNGLRTAHWLVYKAQEDLWAVLRARIPGIAGFGLLLDKKSCKVILKHEISSWEKRGLEAMRRRAKEL
ncbi:hypothetical protein LCGC14_1017140 [marine sediment metagenome]|uniref:Uncharacterized protein n=1 Tax=marine sediment metagenome TaxID=412755 RepID=A0A0F9N349_9ZZZZ